MMKNTLLAFTILAFTATSAAAQNPVSDSLRSSWAGAKRNIKASAELMEEANYSFKPSPDVRSFGELLAHVAGASYMFCAAAKGEKSPFAEEAFEKTATTKAALVKVTNDAIAYCDGAYAAATDATLGQMVAAPFGSGQVPRANPLIGQIGHNNEHYGNLVTYFRIKGIVPPSSRR
jgi:uncharacterized damage-inducible protein DinB